MRMLPAAAPLVSLAALQVAAIDVRVEHLARILDLLGPLRQQGILVRDPRRSPLSSKTTPRVVLQLAFPKNFAELDALLVLHPLRASLPSDAFYGLQGLFHHQHSLILEVGDPGSFVAYWGLCGQMVLLGPRKALVMTDASELQWSKVMDCTLRDSDTDGHAKLRWRPSMLNGQVFAHLSVTPTALNASKRLGARAPLAQDYATTVSVRGELGTEDAAVMALLMQHVAKHSVLQLVAATSPEAPRAGEYLHLSSIDDAAPPGRVKVMCATMEDVRRAHAALHGRTVQVGLDRVGIYVSNDILSAASVMGDNRRRQS